jgi:hypothetical protein
LDAAKARIKAQVGDLIGFNIGTMTAFGAIMGFGQWIAALYTKRQSIHIAKLMLTNNRLYTAQRQPTDTISIEQLPTLLSSDLPALNEHLCYVLFGSLFYGGVFSIIAQLIALGQLLYGQSEGPAMLSLLCRLSWPLWSVSV